MEHEYFSIEGIATGEWKDRGSKFIAYAFPIQNPDEVKQRLEDIKKAHPKASHYCYAYRIGTDKSLHRSYDDGEPSGTAGKPILGQIDSKRLTNTLIIVVRYFGGTLLGVPGLIQAYKNAAAECLHKSKILRKDIEVIYLLEFDHTRINEVMQRIKKNHIRIIGRDDGIYCIFRIGIPIKELTSIQKELLEIPGTTLKN